MYCYIKYFHFQEKNIMSLPFLRQKQHATFNLKEKIACYFNFNIKVECNFKIQCKNSTLISFLYKK